MRDTMLIYIDRFRHDRHSRRVLGSVLLVLAIVVSLTVYWQLRLNGIAITNETYCGYEEHVHTDDCYETTLICSLEETEGHTHDESCYDEEGNLICGLEEKEAHAHTDECYEKTLVCELEVHTHTVECLVDLTADVEDATIWEATLPEFTGDLRTDIVNIAYSQLGYTESTANYTIADDGTKMGYTRYGAWYGGLYYGSEYSDWDSLFVAFCLDYAGISEDFTYSSGAYAWSVDLTALGYYQTVDVYSPTVGDVAFIDTDADGRANITAIVVSIDETAQTITAIQGNYTVTDSEGNSTDTVAVVTYSTATEIATQNEIVALSAGSATEITPVILGYANVTYVNPTYVNATYVAEAEEETEEITLDEEESAELIEEEEIEEITVEEIDGEETEEVEETVSEEISEETATAGTEEVDEQVDEEETAALLTATASTDYVTQVTDLYDYAMTLGAGDTTAAESVWSALMSIWEQIYAEEDAGALTLTAEEYNSIDALTDEVYDYFVNTVGYDPYGAMTADESLASTTVTINGDSYPNLVYYATTSMSENGTSYYDSDSDAIYVPLILNFRSLTVGGSNSTTYAVALPEGVVPNVDLNKAIDARDSSPDFTMTFVQDSSGNYYVIINFDVTTETTVDSGYVSFEAVYDNSETDVPITITYTDGTEFTIEITSEDIESDGNETYDADVNVKKTSGSYSLATNSVTYTVTVSSTKGTGGDIILTDLLAASGLTTTEVKIDSVTLNGESVTNYTATLTSAESFTVILEELEAGGSYVITYTIYFDNTSTEVSATLTNIATAEVEDKDIEAEVTNTKYVNTSVVGKSGTYDESDKTITWTITVNAYGADIAGYTFTDDAFANAYTNKTLQVSGNSSDWGYVYDDVNEGTVTGIKFVGTTTDGDNDNSTNTNTYTITYTEEVESSTLGTSTTYKNIVSVTDDEGKEVTEKTATVTVKDTDLIGDLSKTVAKGGTDSDGNRILNWTSTLTVPEGGIAANTVVTDGLASYSGDKTTYQYGTNSTRQWFTYDQLIGNSGFFTDLVKSGITIGETNIEYRDGENFNFTLEAYDATTNTWVDYETLSNDSETYSEHVFTAYRITFKNDVEVSKASTMTLSYSTTAYITGVTTERTFYNTIWVNDLTASAEYTEYITVYKTDGKGSTSDSTRETTDGTVTWKVYVYVAEGTTNDIVMKDTLPDGVSFASATVSFGSTILSYITEDNETWSATNNVTVSVDTTSAQDVMTITVPGSVYSSYASSGGYIIVTYTCKIDTFDEDTSEGTVSHTWSGLKNSATVTIGSKTYEEVTQTQKVTYTYTEDDSNYIVKDYTYDSINNYLNYYVVVNPGADNLVNGDTLDFTDVVTAKYGLNYTWGAVVELITDSVNFYELIELSEDSTGGYYYTVDKEEVYLTDCTDSDLYESGGKVYYKSLLDIAWTYDVTYYTQPEGEAYVDTYHTISATIPDSTAIYVEYSYSWLWLYQSGISTGNDLKNEVTIKGVSSVSKDVQEIYVESKVSGSASSGNVFTLTKIDSTSMTTTLSGAEFTIYKYVDGTNDTSTGVTLTTDENGTLTVTNSTITDYAKNTLYYLVESKAPVGYTLDSSTRYYFFWSDSSDTNAYNSLKTLLASIDLTSNPVDLSTYSGSTYAKNTASTASTTLTIEKVSSTHSTTRLAGATYTLQKYNGSTWEDVTNNGAAVTFTTTSPLGQFTVSMEDLTGLTYNQAYRLVEIAYPDGYEPATHDDDTTDQTEVYFWWLAKDTSTYPEVAPSGWSASNSNDGSSISTAIDLGTTSQSVTVTNTPILTTSVSVAKSWTVLDENDETISDPDLSTYTATVQLYYYLTEDTTSSGNTGGTESDSVAIYFVSNKVVNFYNEYTESIANSNSYTHYSIPSGQENVSIKLELSGYNGWWYEAYALVDNVYSSYDAGTQMSASSWLSEALDVRSFTASADYYVIYSSPAATKITISYTDSSSGAPVYYEYTYTTTDGWSQTKPETAGTGGTGQTTPTVIKYADLTGNGTDTHGVAYADSGGDQVIITLTSKGWVLNGGTDVTTYETDWTATIADLPQYTYINGTKYYYNYYFVETSASDSTTDTDNNGVTYVTNAEYSTADGVTNADTPITITNTVTQTEETILPSTGGVDYTTMYDFGIMLILLSLVGAGAYRNVSRIRKSLVEEPHRDGVDPGGTHERLPDVRNRKFVIPRTARKGDTRAGPDDKG